MNHLVRFSTGDDDVADRVAAIIHALGYAAERVGEEHGPRATAYRLERLARSRKLTDIERLVLESIVAGMTNVEIGQRLDISGSSVKWHLHNVFVKTGACNREGLLRMLLVDGGP